MVKLHQIYKLATVILCGIFAAALLVPIQASAEGVPACDPIASGLWTGVGFVSGVQFDCHGNPVGGESAGLGSEAGMAPAALTGQYVALGDSVAAGLGLPLDANSPNNPSCGVSDQAYAADVALSLHMPFQNDACSGATAGDLVTDQSLSGSDAEIQPQLDTAFANGTPSLITITAGANDVYWSAFLKECYVSTCGSSADKAAATGLQAILQAKLAYVFNSISSRSGGSPPPVVLTGYYQPLSEACITSQGNITADEITFIRSQTTALNQAISTVADNYSFVRFAPVDFSGHELCSPDPWVQGLDGVAPFHPTAQGQQAIAESVLASIH